ncbi:MULTISPECIES: MDR family MFS transporter [Thermocrispum]|jgi:EmrB/QacA subfamily drug resistance transporter|uniref:MDR family MFS transporter n=2 Tax=Thermocrispum agreste TaxID=37925 RepID=A0ABD6FEY3_9PSEU
MSRGTTHQPPTAAPDADEIPLLSHRQIVTILSGLMMGMLLASLDQTIVSTAIRTIADDLHGLSIQAWATTAYLITATITTPIYGKLSDIYGRKPLYLTAISVFLIGSLACTFATSMYELAVYRAVQGLGAGGLMSLAMTIVGDIIPPRRRARYAGYMMSVWGVSSVLGPVLGGLFAGMDTFVGLDGWRWVFLVNLPVGIVALVVVTRVLNVPHQPRKQRIDWWGAATLTAFLVPLLILAEQGRQWGWTSTTALVCVAVGLASLVAFVLVQRRMGEAGLIPLRLFTNKTFTVALIAGFILGVAMFGAIVLIPQYLQIVQGFSPTEAGLLSLPMMVGMMSSTLIVGRITQKTGRYKIFPIIGTMVISLGSLLFAQLEWNSPTWHALVLMAVIGAGLGACMQTLMIAVQNAGPRRDMGVSTASATLFRQVGGTLGVAVFLSILFSTLSGNIASAFRSLGVSPAAVPKGVDVMADSSFLQEIPLEQAKPFLIGFTESINSVFYVASAVALLATVVLLFLKEIPLADARGPHDRESNAELAATTAG